MKRREFLKRFGIGVAVAPVAASALLSEDKPEPITVPNEQTAPSVSAEPYCTIKERHCPATYIGDHDLRVCFCT